MRAVEAVTIEQGFKDQLEMQESHIRAHSKHSMERQRKKTMKWVQQSVSRQTEGDENPCTVEHEVPVDPLCIYEQPEQKRRRKKLLKRMRLQK